MCLDKLAAQRQNLAECLGDNSTLKNGLLFVICNCLNAWVIDNLRRDLDEVFLMRIY